MQAKVQELVKTHGVELVKWALGTAFAAGMLWATVQAKQVTTENRLTVIEKHVEEHDAEFKEQRAEISDVKANTAAANGKLDAILALLRRRSP